MKRFDQIPEELKELFHQKAEKIEFALGHVFCDFNSTQWTFAYSERRIAINF